MEGKNRFTPKQINKALRLLREMPVKDGRKGIRETLRLLEEGMKDALEKGYSRTEIRQKIAEAEVIISATTLKSFLAGEQKENGQRQDEAAAGEPEKNGRHSEGEMAGIKASPGPKPGEKAAGPLSPGSIYIKPDTPLEDL